MILENNKKKIKSVEKKSLINGPKVLEAARVPAGPGAPWRLGGGGGGGFGGRGGGDDGIGGLSGTEPALLGQPIFKKRRKIKHDIEIKVRKGVGEVTS